MKRQFLLLVFILVLECFTGAQRLPQLAVPENYKLTFTPDFTNDNFTGEETIQIRVLTPTSQIVLNAAEIDFQEADVSAGLTQNAKITLDKEKEMATLTLETPIQPGPATIHVRYRGSLNSDLRGFYRGKEANGKKYAATQFESTDARRAFPSFDEPAYKATFDISVIADKGDTAISNGKVIADKPGPGSGKHTIGFATTPKMSSYLVALAVGNFEYIEGSADGIPIRVWAAPGKKHLGTFALETAQHCLSYFDNYFGIKYPFGKLDMIALPDFGAGAMENTGAITYRELDLLLDAKHASIDQQKNVASTVSHEIAHQWFGDLVTMKWWDDIWLNEGFANWMQNKPIAVWKPEWNLGLNDVQSSDDALNLDSLTNTRPIHQAAKTPEQIEELFDTIAYNKAAAVLQMLEAYVGPATFRAGVNEYLMQYAYGNATADDLWNTLAVVSKKPVDRIMASFVGQPGAPMISVEAECAGNTTGVTLSQTRYFYNRDLFSSGSNELWVIPVCMKAGAKKGGKIPERCELLTKKQESFTLQGCSSWVLANAGAMGYYRSGYQPEAIRAMSHSLETDSAPGERIRLLSDVWASVRVGRQPIGEYVALAEGMQFERNAAVMDELTGQLQYVGDYLLTGADREAYQQWVRRLLTPASKELGWKPAADDNDDRNMLRAHVLYTLGYTGRDPAVLGEASKLAQLVLAKPDAVDATIASTVFGLAALNGDASLYNKIMDRMKKAASPEEYYILVGTLSQFSDPQLLERTLQFALTSEVRSQDVSHLITGVMMNPAGSRVAWDFMRAHWTEIEKVLGALNMGNLVASTASFCDSGLRDEVRDFFAAHQVPAAERTLRQSLESVTYCVDLKSQQASHLASWLDQQGRSTGK